MVSHIILYDRRSWPQALTMIFWISRALSLRQAILLTALYDIPLQCKADAIAHP